MTERTGQIEMGFGMDAAIERASEWAIIAQRKMVYLPTGTQFTADDIRESAGDPPAHGDALGSVIRNAQKAGLIRPIGYTTSTRPERHGATIRVWEKR